MTTESTTPDEIDALRERDFALYADEFQRNEEYNDARLAVRRRLDNWGKAVAKALTTKEHGLVSRASLHHPYKFNGFRVRSQFLYLSRADKERKQIKQILGVELGKDLDQNYSHVVLVAELYRDGVELALRVHKDAWWDGENLKRLLKTAENRDTFAALLRELPEYGLRVGDHKRIHPCETMTAAEVAETFEYYKPGETWLHIARDVDRDDPFLLEDGLTSRLSTELKRLMPTYGFIKWSRKNNLLFSD